MNRTPDSVRPDDDHPSAATVDLNELLLDHPHSSYVFRCGDEMLIVDRALIPHYGSIVVIARAHHFCVEPFDGQPAWGVVTYRVQRTA
jgi:hypothetical protein